MVKYARTQDIPDIWAGNYGALTDSISHHFDQAFTGYSEQMIADKIGRKLQQHQILHPPIITPTRLYFGIHLNCMGILYTNRGCNNSCDFCQTPSFCQKPYKLSIESIETVLRYYKKVGISELIIIDENFGVFKKHAEQVVDLLDKYGFYWFVMTRADILKNRLDDWSEKRMAGAFIGIESFNEETLLKINKKEKADEILKVINRMKELNRFIIGYYMLGFETDTIASLKKDLRRLSELKLDITQLCVVTPFPRTPLWDHIEKTYGIFDKDYHHFNAKHLVWNHPHISPDEMSSLIEYGFKICYPSTRLFHT
jgi:radical SAM superfamily enzyme YgiQ (UPF0313 family)